MGRKLLLFFMLSWVIFFVHSAFVLPGTPLKIARLKYSGGGDWYLSPTSLPNLIKYCNTHLGTQINPNEETVEPASPEIFNYPFIHITGHGNILFSPSEANNLRKYLESGGFLNINDSYGLDKNIRRELKKIFPETELQDIPFSHPVYHEPFNFPTGLPKIHEHDNKPPKGYGIILKGRLVCFYNYECDLGDGWESPDVHHDPDEKRIQALQMGANIIQYAFTH